MSKRRKWLAHSTVKFHGIRDSEFAEALADLGELIYGEISSCQLLQEKRASSIAHSSDEIVSATTARKERVR